MMLHNHKSRTLATLLFLLVVIGSSRRSGADDLTNLQRLSKLKSVSENLKPGAHSSQMGAALLEVNRWKKWQPRINEEKPRGPASDVYSKAGPSVVVVRTESGHGTGFIVDKRGWIITNHHVIAEAAIDEKTGAPLATIHLGTLTKGLMKLDGDGIPAHVFASSEEKDLALLKLTSKPDRDLTVATLADEVPTPGTQCIVVGHPAAGILWTLRTGILSGAANWPRDMISMVMAQLTIAKEDAKELQEYLASAPQKEVILSTCGLNPGDSGGPLFNEEGQVIAVSFAIPKDDKARGVSLSKFSYHVHLDELKTFLKANKSMMENKDARPPIVVPDAWPVATSNGVLDFDLDGTEETRMFAVKDVGMTGFLIDLDQNSDLQAIKDDPLTKKWDFEFAMHGVPRLQTFYDSDNDGQLDLILIDTDKDGKADVRLEKSSSNSDWKRTNVVAQPMFEFDTFDDKRFVKRLATVFSNMSKALESQK